MNKQRIEKLKDNAINMDIAIKGGVSRLIKPFENNDGWGRDEVIAVAIALVIAAFVVTPQLKTFAGRIMTKVDTWYTSIESRIFNTSP